MAGTPVKPVKAPLDPRAMARCLLAVGSLLLMGSGAWILSPAAALLLVGGLVWIDLQLWSWIDRRSRAPRRDGRRVSR